MRRIVVATALAALFALSVFSAASAVVPIPVNTAVHDNGVFVQVHTQRVFDSETGEAIGKEVTHCSVNVWTTTDGVGETMTATDGSASYSATVNPVSFNGSLYGGRAVFTGIAPGVTLTTTNTDVAVSGACPSNQPPA